MHIISYKVQQSFILQTSIYQLVTLRSIPIYEPELLPSTHSGTGASAVHTQRHRSLCRPHTAAPELPPSTHSGTTNESFVRTLRRLLRRFAQPRVLERIHFQHKEKQNIFSLHFQLKWNSLFSPFTSRNLSTGKAVLCCTQIAKTTRCTR